MTDQQVVAHPDAAVSAEFTELASDERIATAAAALERNGIRPLLAATGADARGLVGSLLVDGAEVYNNTSQTLEAIGVADDIERSGRYQPLRLRLYRMDREMQRPRDAHPGRVARLCRRQRARADRRRIAAHRVRQRQPAGPARVGGGAGDPRHRGPEDRRRRRTGMRRIYEYCYPLEDARARQAYGVPSGVNNILIINKVMTPGRVTAIIVKERLGF